MEIRLATEHDAAAIADIYRPYVTSTPITFEIEPPGEQEMRGRIAATLAAYPWLVAVDDGGICGYAYANAHAARAAYRWSVNVSVYLAEAVHRRGIGRGLYTSLLNILAAQGFVMAYGGITLPNEKSVGVHEAMGFRPVGVYHRAGFKMGRWYDVGWWERPLRTAADSPSAPGLLSELQQDPSWPGLLTSGLAHMRTR